MTPLFALLSSEQQAVFDAVQAGEKDVLCIAGPGSGKTHTLISSVCGLVQGGMPGEKIVAITFTNNAAAELQVRLVVNATTLGLPALHRIRTSTFHSWVGQLASRQITPWTYPPVRMDTAGLAVALHLTNPDSVSHVFTKAEISAADRHLERSETFDAMEARNFNRIGEKESTGTNRQGFEKLKKAEEDLSPLMEQNQLSSYGSMMAAGADLATHLIRGSISWLFIDEAQDLNAPQAAFIAAVQQQTGCRVFAIADDDQGIYKFRGASNQFLREFGAKESTATLNLTENFRSTQPIVKVCRNWIEPNWAYPGATDKKLHSIRNGLPVVVLQANYSSQRGKHAKIIIDAAKKAGLIKAYGETAALSFTAKVTPYDVRDSELPCTALADRRLPDEVFKQWLELCKDGKATDDWHHALWEKFLQACTADQKNAGDPILGHPGLNGLYAALETIRRIQPGLPSHEAAEVFTKINPKQIEDSKKFFFFGDRPEPDYAADAINLLSLHSCKGMEFPIVWMNGCGFAFSSKQFDQEQGQPNVLGELGDWAKKYAQKIKGLVTGTADKPDPAACNKLAIELENRRLLYVGMSRATDLLIISAPPGYAKNGADRDALQRKKDDDHFKAEMERMLKDVDHRLITTDADAQAFARSITASHRHPTWTAPTRYRVESFTSLTRQPQPGETLETEIPREREFPQPQSDAAMIGDQFHRIMHLLCLEPETLAKRLKESITDADLIARVSTRNSSTDHTPLADLLDSYFSDTKNKPWEWLAGSKSEVPFTHVTTNDASETVLVKGYIDLVGFDADGKPNLIIDYKTGNVPSAGSPQAERNQKQIELYRKALAATYSVPENHISLVNYYPQTKDAVTIASATAAHAASTSAPTPLPDGILPEKQRIPLGNNWLIQINPSEKNQLIYIELREKKGNSEITREKMTVPLGDLSALNNAVAEISRKNKNEIVSKS